MSPATTDIQDPMSPSTPVLSEDPSTPSMVMVLEAAGLRLAVPLANTLEVRQAERLVKPCALAPYQQGMLVLRGSVLPVFNLSALAQGSLAAHQQCEPPMHLVVCDGVRTFVLGVDAVLGVEAVSPEQLKPAPTAPAWIPQLYTSSGGEVAQLADVSALADIAGVGTRKG